MRHPLRQPTKILYACADLRDKSILLGQPFLKLVETLDQAPFFICSCSYRKIYLKWRYVQLLCYFFNVSCVFSMQEVSFSGQGDDSLDRPSSRPEASLFNLRKNRFLANRTKLSVFIFQLLLFPEDHKKMRFLT